MGVMGFLVLAGVLVFAGVVATRVVSAPPSSRDLTGMLPAAGVTWAGLDKVSDGPLLLTPQVLPEATDDIFTFSLLGDDVYAMHEEDDVVSLLRWRSPWTRREEVWSTEGMMLGGAVCVGAERAVIGHMNEDGDAILTAVDLVHDSSEALGLEGGFTPSGAVVFGPDDARMAVQCDEGVAVFGLSGSSWAELKNSPGKHWYPVQWTPRGILLEELDEDDSSRPSTWHLWDPDEQLSSPRRLGDSVICNPMGDHELERDGDELVARFEGREVTRFLAPGGMSAGEMLDPDMAELHWVGDFGLVLDIGVWALVDVRDGKAAPLMKQDDSDDFYDVCAANTEAVVCAEMDGKICAARLVIPPFMGSLEADEVQGDGGW